jgi:hypothetical protein
MRKIHDLNYFMHLAGRIIEHVVVGALKVGNLLSTKVDAELSPGPACVVGASAPYSHGGDNLVQPLAGYVGAGHARDHLMVRGYEKLLSGHPHGPLLQ